MLLLCSSVSLLPISLRNMSIISVWLKSIWIKQILLIPIYAEILLNLVPFCRWRGGGPYLPGHLYEGPGEGRPLEDELVRVLSRHVSHVIQWPWRRYGYIYIYICIDAYICTDIGLYLFPYISYLSIYKMFIPRTLFFWATLYGVPTPGGAEHFSSSFLCCAVLCRLT